MLQEAANARAARGWAICSKALAYTIVCLLALAGDAARAQTDFKLFRDSYPTPDVTIGERLQPQEIENAFAISEVIIASLGRRFADTLIRRDAHPKAHGCVKGEFAIEPDLTPDLAKGAFQPGARYRAWVRFSNGNEDPERPDGEGDGRGMAIKLLGVPGDNLLAEDSSNMDLIMISHPTFFVNDLDDYLSVVSTVNTTSWLRRTAAPLLMLRDIGVRGLQIVLQTTRLRISNPLDTRYWSMVPYRLGEATDPDRTAVKFSSRPCFPVQSEPAGDNAEPDFLRAALSGRLTQGACMEFLVQPRRDPSLSIEDSQREWEEADAPFYRVASILFPPQSFDTAEQNEFCEALSFNPWRTRAAHRPLGAVNRARKGIYERVSHFRREANTFSTTEPLAATGTPPDRPLTDGETRRAPR